MKHNLKPFFVVAIALILLVMTGCGGVSRNAGDHEGVIVGENGYTLRYNNDIPVGEMEFSETDISDYEYLAVPNEIDVMNSRTIPVEFIEEKISNLYLRNNKGTLYGIVKLQGESESGTEYLFILFDNQHTDGYVFADGMLLRTLFDAKDFSGLENGTSDFQDVKRIDTTALIHGGMGEKQNEGMSFHRCNDGTIIRITYERENESYVITRIDNYTDPIGFVSKLLPIDLNVIH